MEMRKRNFQIFIHPKPDNLGYAGFCWDYFKECKFRFVRFQWISRRQFKKTYPYKVKFHISLTKQEAVHWCWEDKDLWIYCIDE